MRQIIFRLLSFRDFVRGLDKNARRGKLAALPSRLSRAAGYAGYLSAMHIVMAAVALCVVTGTWYGVYRMTERR
jgi:hypothetical protein